MSIALISCNARKTNYYFSKDNKGYYAIIYGVDKANKIKKSANGYEFEFNLEPILLVNDSITYESVDPHFYTKDEKGGITEIHKDSITVHNTRSKSKNYRGKTFVFKYEYFVYGHYEANSSHQQIFNFENTIENKIDSILYLDTLANGKHPVP